MTDQMAKLREYRLRRPFKPYTIVLRSGTRIDVRDRFQVAVEHGLTYASCYDEDHAIVTLMPRDLERVEDPPAGAPSAN